ncbi:MAG: hypothetical protein U9Q71_06170, partial [Pseudomonadota bacterium]|nr:hypothetical protein [Pseudomonadota bacterium]
MKNLLAAALLSAPLLGAPAFAAELTPDYLTGEWCFASFDDKGEKRPNYQTWEFKADSSFHSQLSEYSTKLKPVGSWEIKDGKLKIYPGYMDTFSEVEIVS